MSAIRTALLCHTLGPQRLGPTLLNASRTANQAACTRQQAAAGSRVRMRGRRINKVNILGPHQSILFLRLGFLRLGLPSKRLSFQSVFVVIVFVFAFASATQVHIIGEHSSESRSDMMKLLLLLAAAALTAHAFDLEWHQNRRSAIEEVSERASSRPPCWLMAASSIQEA